MTLSAPPAGDVAIGPGRLARSRATQTLESIQRGAEVVVPAPVRHANTLAAVAMDLVLATVALAVTLLLTLDLDRVVFGALVVAWPAILASNGYYLEGPFGRSLRSRSRRIVRSGAVVGLLCWAGHAATVPGLAPAQLLPATVALTLAGLTGAVLRVGDRAPRVVVAGHPSDVRDAVSELRRSRRPVDLAAVCLTEAGEPDESFADLPVHIGVNDAPEVASGVLADSLLVLPGPDLTAPQLRRLQWQAAKERTAFYLGTGLLDVAPVRLTGVETGGLGALHVRPAPVRGPRRQVKEIGERMLAALALALLLPMLLAVAVAVRRDSPGPAIFRQQRVGRNGKHFTMWKFRTMTTSAPAEVDGLSGQNDSDGCLFKLREDPRITRVGGVLRRYSVDELPQLWNVVTGQMSLVGPRPALPTEVERYDDDPRRRLAVKPGLTGLWQVSGRSDLSWAESVRLDLQYVDNWSLSLDVSILRRTVGAVLGHRGAY